MVDTNKEQNQESQQMEWKWSWQDEYLKWLCGYANMEGGILYIGVNDDGYVVGIEDSKKILESLPNKITDKLGIIASINIYKSEGAENIRYGNNIPYNVADKIINQYACGVLNSKTIERTDKRYTTIVSIENENKIWETKNGIREYISIEIVKYPFAISYDGKYYKRSGSTLHELNGFELQNFLLERAGKTWDSVPVPEVKVSDLSKDAIDTFRRKAVKSNRMTETEVNVSDELLLRNLKLFDGEYLTRAAILLFHPDPEQFATGAYIKLGFFAPVRVNKDGKKTTEDLLYQDVVQGPLITQVDKAIDLIFTKYFKFLIDYEGIQRIETPMLSRDMVREILLNAVNHKEYASGVPIQVAIYDDYMKVFNMGNWPERVPSDLSIFEQHESVPNNPKIANVSFRSGDVEAWGRGYLKIKSECDEIKAPLPIIDIRGGGVSVRADGCEKYMKLLRYGQYGQIGADGIWKNQDGNDENERSLKEVLKNERSLKEVLKETLTVKDYERLFPVIVYMEEHETITTEVVGKLTGKSYSTAWRYLQKLISAGVLESAGSTNNSKYKRKHLAK